MATFAEAVKELRDAAEPFTSGDIVDETVGTEPLMERLEIAIRRIDDLMSYESEVIKWLMKY